MTFADHPHTDPGDGRTECDTCGKFVFPVIHSCKRVPVTEAARIRAARRARVGLIVARQTAAIELAEITGELKRTEGNAP